MSKLNSNVTGGLILIAVGTLLLLHQLNIFYIDGQFIASILFLGLGIVALISFAQDRAVWKVILGVFLIGLSSLIYLETQGIIYGDLTGAFFLWALSAGFIAVFLFNRANWWAIIPGGVLLTLGIIVLLESMWFDNNFIPVVLFGGISLTFWTLFFLRNDRNKLGWAAWPGTFIGLFAVMLWGEQMFWNFGEVFWPAVLIGIGGLLIYRSLKKESAQNA